MQIIQLSLSHRLYLWVGELRWNVPTPRGTYATPLHRDISLYSDVIEQDRIITIILLHNILTAKSAGGPK